MNSSVQGKKHPAELMHESAFTPMQLLVPTLCCLANVVQGYGGVVIAHTAPAIACVLLVPMREMG